MILTVVLLTLSTVNVAFSTLFPHPDMCGVYQQRPLYLDRGMYLVPLVMQLPDNCHKSECRRVDNGTFYRGTQHQTRTGRICQAWATQKPNKHATTKEQIKKFGLEQNYCRNPSMNEGGPWCYTLDEKERWGYCDIPYCSFHAVERLESLIVKGDVFKNHDSPIYETLTKRPKRSVSLLFSAIFSAVSIGFSISNAVRITQLENTFSFLQHNQEHILQSLSETNEALNQLSTNQKELFYAVKHLSKETHTMDRQILCELDTRKTNDIIDAILHQEVTSHVLPIENLIQFLEKENNLRNSIYITYPRLLYKLAKLELINVDATKGIVTLLMAIPHIQKEAEGFHYQPLLTPRFFLAKDGVRMEQPFPLTQLIDIDPTLPHPKGRYLWGVKPDQCLQHLNAFICKVGAHYSDNHVQCSNAFLQNSTDYIKLKNHCGYSITEKPDEKWEKTECSFVAQTATHALIFTNEKVVAKTDIGPIPIRKDGQAPACLFINKLSVKELKVGNKTLVLNARLDAITIKQNLGSSVYEEFLVETKMPKLIFPTVQVEPETSGQKFFPKSQWQPNIFEIISVTFGSLLGLIFFGLMAFCAFKKIKKNKKRNGKKKMKKKMKKRQYLKRFVKKVEEKDETESEESDKESKKKTRKGSNSESDTAIQKGEDNQGELV